MNAYVTDRIAREHADRLMADAAAIRRARAARRHARRATAPRSGSMPHRSTGTSPEQPAAARSVLVRPFAAVHGWFAAGQL